MPRTIKLLLFVSAIVALLLNPIWIQKMDRGTHRVGAESLKELFPSAISFSSKTGDPLHYKAYKDGPRSQGYCFLTTDIVPHERGYAGPIAALACMDATGRLSGVKILHHRETPAYAHKIEEPQFLNQFKGKSVKDQFIIGKDLDGIARASVSSEVVARSVKKSARAVARAYMGIDIKEEKAFSGWSLLEPGFILLVFSLAIVGMYVRSNGLRWAVLVLSLIGLGFVFHSYLSINTIINALLLRLPPLRVISWYLLLGGVIITTLLYGKLYCGWICPFGAGLEIVEKARKTIWPFSASTSSPQGERRARLMKYLVLWLGVTAFALSDNVNILGFEPFAPLFTLSSVNTLALGLLLLALGSSLFIPRFWCRYLCPAGACLSLLSQWSPWRLRSSTLCDACGECIPVCPTRSNSLKSAKKVVEFNPQECLLCSACARACPPQAITPGPQ